MARRPALYHPQLALLMSEAPAGPQWVHELKYDGYRIGCLVERGRVTLLSRKGKDWTAQFPEVAQAAAALPVREALLDGEVAIVDREGKTSFQRLQNAFGGGDRAGLAYFAFDLLRLDGEEVARRPLLERKRLLARLLDGARDGGRLRYAEHFDEDGPAVKRRACALGAEGIVSKRRDLPYRPGRSGEWVKSKCTLSQEVVVGGFTDPEGSRAGIGALLAGYHDDDARLIFAGKVGTGFTNASATALRRRLEPLEQRECPFAERPPGWLGRNAHWVKPVLVGMVEFAEWTSDGKLRHPSWKGLREDKPAREVTREVPADGAADAPPADAPTRPARRPPARAPRRTRAAAGLAEAIGGVRVSSPDRVLFPEPGFTKRDLARYYERVAEWMVPHLAGRPLTLVHCPEGLAGGCHYMKHSRLWAPEALRRVRIQETTKVGEYLIADTAEALLSLAQMDVLEIHTWNTRFERVEQPDRIVLDLDPGPEVRFAEVVGAARMVRSGLDALGLESFVKTTGGSGLHVVVPLAPERGWSECLAFARAFSEAIARHDRRRFTTALPKQGRERKILLDYLRNNRTNTSVAAYSTRARPHATVSVPLAWDELSARATAERFTLATVPRRLAALRADPWARYFELRQRIPPSALAALDRA